MEGTYTSKGILRVSNVNSYQRVRHVNHSQPDELPYGPLPVETIQVFEAYEGAWRRRKQWQMLRRDAKP